MTTSEYVVSSEQMQCLEQETISAGLSALTLMERAAVAMEQELWARYGSVSYRLISKSIYIFCGKGNNGGDGLALGRLLNEPRWQNAGYCVHLFLWGDSELSSLENKRQYELLDNLGINVHRKYVQDNLYEIENLLLKTSEDDLIIDAFFGVGLSRLITGKLASFIGLLNESKAHRIAIDIPSGLNADTGQPLGIAFQAELTLSCGFAKQGHYMDLALDYVGELKVVDIGIPTALVARLAQTTPYVQVFNASAFIEQFPMRPKNSHKGSFGRLGVVAGSSGMVGALMFCLTAALESGVGLLFGYTASDLVEPIGFHLPEVQMKTRQKIFEDLSFLDYVLLGPGLGRDTETEAFCHQLLSLLCEQNIPVLIDADGLYHYKTWLKKEGTILPLNSILTPHPGEAAHLLGCKNKEIQYNRLQSLQELMQLTGCICLLKGARTLVGYSSSEIYINPTGNSGLSRGGSGDVLAGLTAGFAVQKMPSAVCLSAYLHGAAADKAIETYGQTSLRVPRLCQALGTTLSTLLCVEPACNSVKQR